MHERRKSPASGEMFRMVFLRWTLTASWKPNSTTCSWLMATLSKSSSSLSWESVLAMIFLSAIRTKSARLTTRVEMCCGFSFISSEPWRCEKKKVDQEWLRRTWQGFTFVVSFIVWLQVSSITHLCESLLQVGHHFVPVLSQDVVQGGSSLAVLPKHKETRILLIGRWRCTVVLKVLYWNAGQNNYRLTDLLQTYIKRLI